MYRLMPFTRRALAAAATLAAMAGPLSAQATHAAAAPGCAAATTTLRVGDPHLASFVPTPADTVDMVMERGGQTRNGLFTQQTVRKQRNGRDTWLTVQSSQTPMGPSLDSVWVDAHTWAPIRHVSTFPGGRVDANYAGGRVTGTLVRGDTTRAVDQALDPGIFELTVSSDVVGAVPLCAGSVVHVSAYDPAVGMRETDFRMLGEESIELGGRRYTAFAIATSFNGRDVKLYLDPATRHLFAWQAAGGGVTMRGTSRILPRN